MSTNKQLYKIPRQPNPGRTCFPFSPLDDVGTNGSIDRFDGSFHGSLVGECLDKNNIDADFDKLLWTINCFLFGNNERIGSREDEDVKSLIPSVDRSLNSSTRPLVRSLYSLYLRSQTSPSRFRPFIPCIHIIVPTSLLIWDPIGR